MRTRTRSILTGLAGLALAVSCANHRDKAPSEGRELPGLGAPDGTAPVVEPAPVPPRTPLDLGLPPCCSVRFALADLAGAHAAAVLRGGQAPLSGPGVPMTYADGAWSVTVCVPPYYGATYWYELTTPVDVDLGVAGATEVALSPFAPTEADPEVGTANAFPAADTCAGIDLAVHGRTK